MFLLRSAFWLTLVIMLIPADPQTGDAPRVTVVQAVEAVQATVADLSGFCERNQDVCVTGGAAIQIIGERAEQGVDLIYRYVTGDGADDGIDMAPGAPTGIDMAPGHKGPRRGTLTTDDIALPWQGSPDDPA